MFYVKVRGRKVNIREDNVFTRCPVCGKEHGG
nr:MAG TPA: RNAse domain protein [Caudoviricetes sp.]